jgi:hypothetical protein
MLGSKSNWKAKVRRYSSYKIKIRTYFGDTDENGQRKAFEL